MKRISVIVPVYNAEKWLSETLDSLVGQTYSNIEIICVDDGSKDNSCSVIKTYQAKHPNIVLIQQENSGVCAARNRGIDAASGDYIAFVDADDYVVSDIYEKLIGLMEAEKSDIVFCEFTRFWADGHIQKTIEHNFSKLVDNPQDIKYFLYSTESRRDGDVLHTEDIHGSAWRSVFKKNLLQDNNIRFHTDLKFAEDQIFVLEYLAYCKRISYTDKSYVWYRGWTKKRHYGQIYANQMALVQYQEQIVRHNSFYSEMGKKQLIGYLRCSAYFAIVHDEFSLNPLCIKKMNEYAQNPVFNQLLTLYSFIQKFRIRPEPKRLILFVLLKLKMWKAVKDLYPVKWY